MMKKMTHESAAKKYFQEMELFKGLFDILFFVAYFIAYG